MEQELEKLIKQYDKLAQMHAEQANFWLKMIIVQIVITTIIAIVI